jgi:Mg2+ and Co2+ transporter CorA
MSITLRCVRIVAWVDGAPSEVHGADLPAGGPVWLQLALPRLTGAQQPWFEGSVDPWDETDPPEVDWSRVERVLERLGLGALDHHEQRLLRRLPHLYGRGVARVAREVWGRRSYVPPDLRFFPTVGFRPIDGTDPPRFWTVRMTVGVIRNVVVTVRLPDLWWNDESGAFDYTPGGPLEVARRFYPVAEDVTADDVAEAIGLQQASTARAVSERVRTRLTEIERSWRHEVRSGVRAGRNRDLGDARRVIEMTDNLFQLDRQLSRLLRRLELDGAPGRSIAADIMVRYRFALDELRSLEGNCRLASQSIGQAVGAADQADREHFHFVAAVLGSAILVPTLVATVYGANVALPARDSWRGFIALILFIAAFALFGLFAIAKALPHEPRPARRPWLNRLPVRIVTPVAASAAFAGGVLAAATQP